MNATAGATLTGVPFFSSEIYRLAEIDAPDVDQQLSQARAMLNQAEANLELAKITAARYQDLIQTKSVSQQEVDQNNQNLAAQQANVQAATANVGRLEQMQGFENGRLQTAARAVGVMQAAYEAAASYAAHRVVFGLPIGEYQLTQVKLGRMAMLVQATRQFAQLAGEDDRLPEAPQIFPARRPRPDPGQFCVFRRPLAVMVGSVGGIQERRSLSHDVSPRCLPATCA